MRTLNRNLVLLLSAAVLLAAIAAPAPRLAAADPVQALAGDPVALAVQWLHTQQLTDPGHLYDGAFGVNGKASAAMTADVVFALALAGEDPGGPAWTKNGQSALDALAKLAPAYAKSDAGQAGKVAAVAAAGRNPRAFGGMDLIGVIQAAYDPATGRYHPSYLYRHTVAVEALQRSNVPVPGPAYSALRQTQLADGGWAWAFPLPGKTPPPSDVDTTGRVLTVLGRAPLATCDVTLAPAADFLARAQLETAGWADVPAPTTKAPNANSTGLAVGGLRASGRNPDAAPFVKGGKSALQALLAFQEASGAFVYTAVPGGEEIRLTATADALAGLLQAQGQPGGECRRMYLPVLLVR